MDPKNGWMDELRFYVLVNSISVISLDNIGRSYSARLCVIEPCLWLGKFLHPVGLDREAAR